MIDCDLVDADDQRWLEVLKSCRHDLYHLPAYARLEGDWIDARPLAFVARSRQGSLLIPLLLRTIPSADLIDAVTPYGYSPPACSQDASTTFMHEAFSAFDALARDRGIISTFMRLHPLLCPSLSLPAGLNRWNLVERGQTVDMPLEDDPEIWERSLVKGHRYDLRRLRRDGCTVEIESDEAWVVFPQIYRETMERIGASPAYFYSDEYLEAFRQTLSDHAVCGLVRDENGEVMCAALFSRVGNLIQYHLSGTVARFANRAPNKLLLAAMREWCRENEIKAFHLGGGFGSGSDTLFNFKRRFGGQLLPFCTVSAVHDAESFDRLCAEWQRRSASDLPGLKGFFPPYRAPVQVAS